MLLSILGKYVFFFGAGFLCTYLLTPVFIWLGHRTGILDYPDKRRIHSVAVPRLGGIAVFTGFHLACAAFFLLPGMPAPSGDLTAGWWRAFLPASSLLLIGGLADDISGIRWPVKLGLQISAGLALYGAGIHMGQIQGVPLPWHLDIALSVIWVVVFVNAFNLIDGIDGLATGLASVAAFGLAALAVLLQSPGDAVVLTGFLGACAAFLRFNFHPARIFLGDAGSMFLGFTLAAASLATSTKGTILATLGVPLLAVGIPVFDGMLAVWRRSARSLLIGDSGGSSASLASPDMEHIHHRLVKAGLTQRRVALVLYGLNLALVLLGLITMVHKSSATGIFLIAFVVGTYVVVRHLASVELWDSGAALLRGLSRPQNPVMVAILYPLVDFAALTLSYLLAHKLTSAAGDAGSLKWELLHSIPIWCGLPFIVLCLAGTYSRVWSRARISEYAMLVLAVLAGGVLGLGLSIVGESSRLDNPLLLAIMFSGTASFFIAGVRAFPRIVQDLMTLYGSGGYGDRCTINTLVVGADLGCLLFLRNRSLSIGAEGFREKVIGLVDDDRNLRKRIVHGYRVLGGWNEIPDIVRSHRIGQIILTENAAAERIKILADFCRAHGVVLRAWITREERLVSESESAPRVDKARKEIRL